MIRSYMSMDIIWIRLTRRLNMPIYLHEFFGSKKSNVTMYDCQEVVTAIQLLPKVPNSVGVIPQEEVKKYLSKGKDPAIAKVINKPKTKDELKEFSSEVNKALGKTKLSVSWRGYYLIIHKN